MVNTINTRIILRNDSISNWTSSESPIHKGEAALALRPDGFYEIRIGTGDKSWNGLSSISDSSNLIFKPSNILNLSDFILTHETNTIYQLSVINLSVGETGQSFQLQKKNKNDLEWENVDGSRFNIPDINIQVIKNDISTISSDLSDLISNVLPLSVQNIEKNLSVGISATSGIGDVLSTYTFTQGGTSIGTINIPKDKVIDNFLPLSGGTLSNTTVFSEINGNNVQIADGFVSFDGIGGVYGEFAEVEVSSIKAKDIQVDNSVKVLSTYTYSGGTGIIHLYTDYIYQVFGNNGISVIRNTYRTDIGDESEFISSNVVSIDLPSESGKLALVSDLSDLRDEQTKYEVKKYSSLSTYNKGDACSLEKKLYVCKYDSVSGDFNIESWLYLEHDNLIKEILKDKIYSCISSYFYDKVNIGDLQVGDIAKSLSSLFEFCKN